MDYADFFSHPIPSGILANLITAVLVVGLGYLTFPKLRRYVQKVRFMMRMKRSGFSNFYCSRNEYSTARKEKTLEDYMLRATSRLTYVGFYLSHGTDHSRTDSTIQALLARGCAVEIVLMHEDMQAEVVQLLEEYLGISSGTLKARLAHAFRHFEGLRETLGREQRERFLVKRHTKLITSSALLFDHEDGDGFILVDSKIWGAGRDKSYGMELRRNNRARGMSTELVQSFVEIARTAA
jgi:hypothetical protein